MVQWVALALSSGSCWVPCFLGSPFSSFGPIKHDGRQIGYAKLPLVVNECLHGALQWIVIPSGVNSSTFCPVLGGIDSRSTGTLTEN